MPDYAEYPQAEDERCIRDLVGTSAYLTDCGDLAGFTDILSDDVTWEMPDGVTVGREAVVRSMAERRAAGVTGPDSHTRHWVRTLFVRAADTHQWVAESMWVFLADTDGVPRIVAAGGYRDYFGRDAAGRVRFTRRVSTKG